MGNRYIYPEDEIEINLSFKVKIKYVGNHSSVDTSVTQKNYDFIFNKIPYEGEINLDFIDRIIYEIVD